jgi:hypothetical protein
MLKVRLLITSLSAFLVLGVLSAGCVSVKAPKNITIGDHPNKVDSSHVPPTHSHEEARQLLGEAYERNRYLETKVDRLERDKDELERERDEYKRKYEREKDRRD